MSSSVSRRRYVWTCRSSASSSASLLGLVTSYWLDLPTGAAIVCANGALLVLASVPDPLGQLIYLAVFNVGVIMGMALITSVLGLPFVYASARFTRVHRALVLASGVVSLGLGLLLVYEIGFVQGLFAGQPIWTPG